MVGVDPRTVRKWTAPAEAKNHRDIPYAAWRLFLQYVGVVDDIPVCQRKIMDAQTEITNLIQELYHEIGGILDDIAHIMPNDGGWGTALSYEVSKKDGKNIRIFRREIDDKENEKIKGVLRDLL